MDFFSIFIFSLVEGVTEFLPISSTGHLMLVGHLLKIPPSDFLSSFEIFIQLGAILAVVVLYFNKIIKNFALVKKIIIAFVPTAVIGFLAYPLIKNFLLESLTTVGWALILGGLVLIVFEYWYIGKDKEPVVNLDSISYKQAFLVGVFQSLAVVPGVSRAGATIVGGLFLGLSRSAVVEFSFLLAIPTVFAATGYDLIKTGPTFSVMEYNTLALGFVFSFVFAILTVRWLLFFVQKYDFRWFGLYRVLLGLAILFVFL